MTEPPTNNQKSDNIPTWKQVTDLIDKNQAGFALLFIGAILLFLSAIITAAATWFGIAGIGVLGVGTLLVIYREITNTRLEQKRFEAETRVEKISDLEQKVGSLQEKLDSKKTEVEEFSNQLEALNNERRNQDEKLKSLNQTLESKQEELDIKETTIDDLQKQLEAKNSKKELSARIRELILHVYSPEFGRTSKIEVIDIVRHFHDEGMLIEDDYHQIMLQMNTYKPSNNG